MKVNLLVGACIQIAITIAITKSYGQAQGIDATITLGLRVWPIENGVFLCRAKNISEHPVALEDANRLFINRNSFSFHRLDDSYRVDSIIGSLRSLREYPPPSLIIEPKQSFVRQIKKDDSIWWETALTGCYSALYWYMDKFKSATIYVAFSNSDGIIASPVVDPRNPDAKPILAFIFHDKRPYDLGFLFLNGSRQDIGVEKPLTKESRIIASSPAIGYTRELFIATTASERIVVEAGKVGEWRLPWQTVRDLIPKDDLERIKAAGGDLDLVWKVGEYQSDPLPLSLADPENITRPSNK